MNARTRTLSAAFSVHRAIEAGQLPSSYSEDVYERIFGGADAPRGRASVYAQ